MPSGWEFIKLSQIGTLCNGYTPKDEDLDTIGTVPYFKISDMNKEGNEAYLNYTDLFAINPKRIFPKNSIVFPKNGGAVFTNKKRILAQDSVVDLNTAVFIPSSLLDMRYAYTIFSTIDFNDFYKGTALPTIKSNFVNTKFYGLPPIAEQKRIIDRIEELFNQITAIEQNQAYIEKLYDEFRKRTLTLAIQGKLVPQNPNDEPASVLLERIRAEKKAKLGKKYVDSFIYKGDDNCYYEHITGRAQDELVEIPFDIPDNWTWAKLLDLGGFSSGKTPDMSEPTYWQNGNVQWFTSKDMKTKYLTESQLKITELAAGDMTLYPANTLLWVVRSGILKSSLPICILKQPATINQDIKAYQLYQSDMIDYVYYMLKGMEAIILDNYVKRITTVHSLKFDELISKLAIPIPPLAEQKRIVAKINEIFAML